MTSNTKRIVALAGLGTIGYHALDAVLASKNWTPIVLTRISSSKSSSDTKYPLVAVDYDDVEGITIALREHKVEAVVSFISVLADPPKHASIHENLIKASEGAEVKRFIPSEWGMDVRKYPDVPKYYTGKIAPRYLLEKSKLEYTLVCNGLFMDYLLPKGKKKHLKDVSIPVDPESRSARIPGNGNTSTTLTSGDDVGKGIVWLLDQPAGAWETYTYLRGDVTSWNAILKQAEGVIGQKFEVTYVSVETIAETEKAAQLKGDFKGAFFAEIDKGYAEGWLELPEGKWEKEQNRTSVREMLMKGYRPQ